MRYLNVRSLLFTALASLPAGLHAASVENFNSKKEIPLSDIRTSLQTSGWSFHHFDINSNGWNPQLEGDGAMVATADATQFTNSGIYTPLLKVSGNLTVSFQYVFSSTFSAGTDRWMKMCLVTAHNEIVQVLETIRFDGPQAVRKNRYVTTFKNLFPGEYRLMLQYGGSGEGAQLAVDELTMSAPYKYAGGGNTAPVAVLDNITGMANRSASGSLLENDIDADHETLTAYLIKGSPDGKVELSAHGSFVFTPNAGFKGTETSFIYKVCDNGSVNLCSENTTVRIHFPEAPRAALNLSDFRGAYRKDGDVELSWKTTALDAGQQFEIERSSDGRAWERSGVIQTSEAGSANGYSFIDDLARNKVLKNDLYYRLKQVDADGSSVSSRLLVVRVYNTRTVTMIGVTPNPAKNDISVNVQLQEDAYVSMRVLDNSGSSIMHRIVSAGAGLSNFIIEGSSQLKPGPYSLEVIVNSKERMLVKLIKE